MLPADTSGDPAERTPADNQTVRNVFVIGPDKKIKLILVYPMTTGRNFDEVLRVIDSLQLTAKHKVATPVNWQQGEDVIIAGSVSDDEAQGDLSGRLEVAEALHPDRAAAELTVVPLAHHHLVEAWAGIPSDPPPNIRTHVRGGSTGRGAARGSMSCPSSTSSTRSASSPRTLAASGILARWLDLLGEYGARDGWWSWDGLRSVADWVAWRCALDPRSAREHVRVARALRELPEIRRAFSAGQLSFSKVRALTRVAEPDSEGRLLDCPPRHRRPAGADVGRLQAPHQRRGRGRPRAPLPPPLLRPARLPSDQRRLTAEQGAIFLAALEAARGSLREAELEAGGSIATGSLENGSAEPENQPEYRELGSADALAAIAETALAQGPTPLSGPERHQLTVHVDLEALLADQAGCVHLRDGPALAPETARRLGVTQA